MKATPLAISDAFLIEPQVYGDDRGFFFESFNQTKFDHAIGKSVSFVQGEVFDWAVDIRKGSPTFGKWVGEVLSAENKRQLWIPEGFAHGFVTMSETAKFLYKTTNYYSQAHERSIRCDDEILAIDWPEAGTFQLSAKDKEAATLDQAEVFV